MRFRPTFIALSLFIQSALFCTGGIAAAASLQETFTQASQAYQSGEYAKAGKLFTKAGDMMLKSNKDQAVAIYGNASVAYIQGKNYSEAADLYRKILSSKAKIDDGQKLKYFQNLVFCLGQLQQYALQAEEIDKVFSTGKDAIKIKLNNDEKSLLLATQGDAYRHHELYDLAVNSYSQSLKNLPKDATAERRATLLTALGLCEGNLGLYDSAVSHLQSAHDVAAKSKLAQTIAESLSNIGIINWEQGDYNEAIKRLSEAIDAENKANLQRNIGVDNNNLGLVYKALGNYKQAMTLVQNSLDIAQEVKNERDEGIATVNRALLYRIAGQYDYAIRDYNRALEIFNKIDFKEGIAGAKLGIGKMISLKDHNYDETLKNYEEALQIYKDLKLIRGETETLIQLGVLYKDMLESQVRLAAAVKTAPTLAPKPAPAKVETKAPQNTASSLFNKFASNKVHTEEEEEIELVNENNKVVSLPQFSGVDSILSRANKQESRNAVLSAKIIVPTLNAEQQEWLKKCREYNEQALVNAEKLQSKEFIWSCHQGLGYCDFLSGNYDSAYEHYKQAIDIVTGIYTSVSDVENFGEYMAGKQDLYTEAQAVCQALYEKTNDQMYLSQMLKYSDTLQNEVQKASASLVNLKFISAEKQKLFEQISKLGKELKAAEKAVPLELAVDKKASADEKAQAKQRQEARKLALSRVDKLQTEFDKLKATWDKKYPQDRLIFDSNSRVDIKMLQDYIKPDQVVLLYTQQSDMLMITAISKNRVANYTVAIGQKQLDDILRNEFLLSYLEQGFGRNRDKYNRLQYFAAYDQVTNVLAELYDYLIRPVEDSLQDKSRIYVIATGLLAQTPFGALVRDKSGDLYKNGGNVDYLIKHYDIGYLRPAFIDSAMQSERDTDPNKVKRLFAVGNPYNPNFEMPILDGTITEVANSNKLLGSNKLPNDLALEVMLDGKSESAAKMRVNMLFGAAETAKLQHPTEEWLRNSLKNNKYEVVYFATHGMPYSNVVSTLHSFANALKKNNIDPDKYIAEYRNAKSNFERLAVLKKHTFFRKNESWFRLLQTKNSNLLTNSPLNGLLYLSGLDKDNSMLNKIPTERDGLLTIQEILEMPNEYFSATKYVILSACNTGVTYVSDAMELNLDIGDSLTAEEAKDEMEKLGLIPGVDQVSFVDTFMRKGVDNVYGTLWFVDDAMSSELLTRFMTNLNQKDKYPDAISAFNEAQRSIILDSEAGKTVVNNKYLIPAHPFFWAPGAIFGK